MTGNLATYLYLSCRRIVGFVIRSLGRETVALSIEENAYQLEDTTVTSTFSARPRELDTRRDRRN